MSYTQKIVCLANSKKMSGRCVAGKEVVSKEKYGCWIRPISNRPTEEVSEDERQFENGEDPKLLDIIEIPMLEARPHGHQVENHIIDSRYYWTKSGHVNWDQLQSAVDKIKGPLWINGYHSYNGMNDRIPDAQTTDLGGSLLLIEPKDLTISVGVEGADRPKRKVRANFTCNGVNYAIVVTDPVVEREFLVKDNGTYEVDKALICVSIGEPYGGYCYKLAAAIITPERTRKG